ncbi:MAG: transcription factor [Rhizobiaceae bacterium]|nr:MAG: transcription factor [Rhizobiaceae bacterium]
MAIHVQDAEADWLVREFARRRGLGITEAIKVAVQEANQREERNFEEYRRRIEPIIEQMRAFRKEGGFEEAMQFIDENWDD